MDNAWTMHGRCMDDDVDASETGGNRGGRGDVF